VSTPRPASCSTGPCGSTRGASLPISCGPASTACWGRTAAQWPSCGERSAWPRTTWTCSPRWVANSCWPSITTRRRRSWRGWWCGIPGATKPRSTSATTTPRRAVGWRRFGRSAPTSRRVQQFWLGKTPFITSTSPTRTCAPATRRPRAICTKMSFAPSRTACSAGSGWPGPPQPSIAGARCRCWREWPTSLRSMPRSR